MALSDAEIIDRMRNRGISTDVTDAEIEAAITDWTAYVNERYPVETLGTFTTVADQQEYDLFGTGMPFAGGLEVAELYWLPAGCEASLDIFGIVPLMQSMGIAPPFDRDSYVFNVPGDFIISDRVWAHFRDRFGALRFVTKEGRPGSPILLDPPPPEARTVMARYTRPRTDDEVRIDDALLLDGVEWRLLLLLVKKYALSAGVRIGDHEDKGVTARIYRDLAKDLEKGMGDRLDTVFFSTLSAVDRS